MSARTSLNDEQRELVMQCYGLAFVPARRFRTWGAWCRIEYEDLIQFALEGMCQGASSVDADWSEAHKRNFLVRCAQNRVLQVLRAHHALKRGGTKIMDFPCGSLQGGDEGILAALGSALVDDTPSPLETVEMLDTAKRLEELFAVLPLRQRQAMEGRYAGKSFSEMAHESEMKYEAVQHNFYRAVANLKKEAQRHDLI